MHPRHHDPQGGNENLVFGQDNVFSDLVLQVGEQHRAFNRILPGFNVPPRARQLFGCSFVP